MKREIVLCFFGVQPDRSQKLNTAKIHRKRTAGYYASSNSPREICSRALYPWILTNYGV